MINELYSLARTLEAMGISTEEWHREYKLIPKVSKKNPCIQLWLRPDGEIDRASEMSEAIAAQVRKYGDNQSTFPAFNIIPLYRITDEEQVEAYEKLLDGTQAVNADLIKSWCTMDNWRNKKDKVPDIYDKVYKCTVTRREKLSGAIRAAAPEADNVVTALMGAAAQYRESETAFRQALERCIFDHLSEDGGDVRLYLKLLLHPGDGKKPHKDDRGENLSIMLDLDDWRSYEDGCPVANPRVTEWINGILLCADSDANERAGDASDAFGESFAQISEPMPSVKLRGFEVTLRAMFNAQACQYRYGTIDDGSYPIAKKNRSATQAALGWIAKDENRGKTWRTAGKDEIFFIYPSVLPSSMPYMADLFGGPSENEGTDKSQDFMEVAKKVTNALLGLPPEEVPESIEVFILHKMDKARTKIVFTRQTTPEGLRDAAVRWQRGFENIPMIDVWAFPKKDAANPTSGSPVRIKQVTPFPLGVPRIINKVWKQDGASKTDVKRMQNDQAVALLLDKANESVAAYYLNILLSNSAGLIEHTGNQQHRGLAVSTRNGTELEGILSAMGMLLYQGGCVKEDYMESTAYLIGQLLKVSDELHTMYCIVVRNGDVPPQLVGNNVFTTAADAPERALSIISTRMIPYIGWAKQYRHKLNITKGQESWKAGWYLSLYETIFDKLAPLLGERVRFSDLDKAQLFMGYLASFPKRENTGGDTPSGNLDETSDKNQKNMEAKEA